MSSSSSLQPQQPAQRQTRSEIINDFKTTLTGLMDISDTYAEQTLNLLAVFLQIKKQAKGMVANLDKQLAMPEDLDDNNNTTDNKGNDKTE